MPTPINDPTKRPAMKEAENNAAAWAVFQKFTKPVLLAFSDEDTVMAGADAIWLEELSRYKISRYKTRYHKRSWTFSSGRGELIN